MIFLGKIKYINDILYKIQDFIKIWTNNVDIDKLNDNNINHIYQYLLLIDNLLKTDRVFKNNTDGNFTNNRITSIFNTINIIEYLIKLSINILKNNISCISSLFNKELQNVLCGGYKKIRLIYKNDIKRKRERELLHIYELLNLVVTENFNTIYNDAYQLQV